jgi:hypothetical protein
MASSAATDHVVSFNSRWLPSTLAVCYKVAPNNIESLRGITCAFSQCGPEQAAELPDPQQCVKVQTHGRRHRPERQHYLAQLIGRPVYSISELQRAYPRPTHLTHVRQDVGIFKGPPGGTASGSYGSCTGPLRRVVVTPRHQLELWHRSHDQGRPCSGSTCPGNSHKYPRVLPADCRATLGLVPAGCPNQQLQRSRMTPLAWLGHQ